MRRCGREQEVGAALRAGRWTDELNGHVLDCASCAELEGVARALLGIAAATPLEVPAVEQVWRRSQSQIQKAALKRATRPLLVMRVLTMAYVAVFGAWALWAFRGLLAAHLQGIDRWITAVGAAIGTTWIVSVAVLIIAGTWFQFYAGSRTEGPGNYHAAS